MVLAHAEAIDGQDQNVADEGRLLHKGQVLGVVEKRVVHLQLLKDHVSPGSRPRRVHDLEALGLELADGHPVKIRQVVERFQHAVHHSGKDRMAGSSSNGPLAELEPVGDVGPRAAVTAIELNPHYKTGFVPEGFRDPDVDGLEGDGVGVCVDAAVDAEQEVSQEIRLLAHVADVVVGLDDLGVGFEVALDELVTTLLANQSAAGIKRID